MLYATVLTGSLALTSGLFVGPAARHVTQRPALRLSSQVPLARVRMQVDEEEGISEEEYLAELAAEAGMSVDEYERSTAISEEEYAAEQEQELSVGAKTVINNMKSESGVEFAPWMKVDAEAIAKAKKEREERKARQVAGRSDQMLIDPQAAELGAGGGLKSEVKSEEEVELRWSTGDETGNNGFIVQRRQGGSENWQEIATYENFAPLRTKGPAGGEYVYLDDGVNVGTWVYRIVDCDTNGQRSAICQKLVEIESGAEQTQTLVIGAAIASLALVLVAVGIFADPIQTTDLGGRVF